MPAQDPRSPSAWPCWRSCGAPPFTPELPLGSSREAEPGQGAASPLPWSRSERRCPFQQPQRSGPSRHRPKPQNPVGASCAPASQAERFLSVGFSFSFIVAEVAPVHWVKLESVSSFACSPATPRRPRPSPGFSLCACTGTCPVFLKADRNQAVVFCNLFMTAEGGSLPMSAGRRRVPQRCWCSRELCHCVNNPPA